MLGGCPLPYGALMSKTTINDFQSLHTLSDLANLLGFAPRTLSYVLYKLNGGPNGQYSEFVITKRSAGTRTISAPHTGLKSIQKKLAAKLQDIYMVKNCVHGFVPKRTILTNAQNHSRKKFVFHIDLKDFFSSIHFGRVMGLFAAKPYEFQRDITILIAKIACLNDVLPQGSPCSPVISNMVCAYLDKQLGDLAKNCGCFYTRYADDITFSTNKASFPQEIAIHSEDKWEPSPRLVRLIGDHSFKVNCEKTSMRTKSDRQLVTGIVTNDYPNIQRRQIKQIRSMLHDWKSNGIEKAQERYLKNFDLANRKASKDSKVNFPNVVRGKLEHIRWVRTHRTELLNNIKEQESIRNRVRVPQSGELHTIYKDQYYKYFQRYEQLVIRDCGLPTILGEGETDWMHLKKAFRHFKDKGNYPDLLLSIHKHKKYSVGGIKHLKQFCKDANNLYVKFEYPVICVYDSDDNGTNAEHASSPDGYIAYGNNVYSIVLPKPAHRETDTFAIEQLYPNTDLLKKDKHGRRIFLSTEFNYKTGKHTEDPSIEYGIRARDGKSVSNLAKSDLRNEKVLDSLVCTNIDGKIKSLALSKMDFAISIMRDESPYNKMDFSGFEAVFDLIQKVCRL